MIDLKSLLCHDPSEMVRLMEIVRADIVKIDKRYGLPAQESPHNILHIYLSL
jgi:hypothetical protein